jgi:asparagine synthase (glutamine-hydrolysing)
MCGICGWIDLSRRPKRQQREILSAMTEALAHRGPDDAGIWLGTKGGLGHRRLAVLDLANSRQPMSEQTPRGDVVLVYSGEVYNFCELRKELVTRGCRFRTVGDTEVVLRSYLEWGEQCVEKFTGMFAFGIWDGRTEELFLVRDRLGIKPLYYFPLVEGVLFGSEPKAILCHPDVAPIVDAEGLRQLFGLVRSPGHAVFAGMSEVKPGHFVRLDARGLSEHRYWGLQAMPHLDNLETTVAKTRTHLSRIVGQQLVSDVPLCTLVSGGLDSSTLTALAQLDSLTKGGDPIRTFSVGFGSKPESFVPDAMRATPDDPYIEAVVRHVGSAHRPLVVATSELLSKKTRHMALRARDLPTLGEIDSTLLLLFSAVRDYSTVVLSGEGADELFGGYHWFHNEDIVSEHTFPWIAMARGLGRYSMFEPGGVVLDIATHQADLYADAIRSVPRLKGESRIERRMRELTYLHLTHFLPTPLERKDRMSMAVGLEVRVPYVDHRLVEYVFNVPWALKMFDNQEKSLLRAVSNGLLPAAVASREKSPFPATQDPAYHAVLSCEVNEILAQRTSPVLDLINRSTLRALACMPPTGSSVVRMGLERVLSIHEWLTEYNVSIRL